MPELVANLIRYEPHEHMTPHVDGCRRLSVVVAGSLSESDSARVEHATVGSTALKAPGFVHHNRFGHEGAIVVSAVLPDGAVARLGHRAGTLADWRWHHSGEARLLGLRLAAALRLGDTRTAASALHAVLSTFARSASSPSPASAPVPAVVRRVRDSLRTDPLAAPSVAEMARHEDVHPVSLCRAFHRHVGCSITRYRQRRRVAAAARELIAGRALVDVAFDLGFSDLSHLTRVFRRELGFPPGAFRRALADAGRFDSFKTEWALAI